jgi:hypothetical protein
MKTDQPRFIMTRDPNLPSRIGMERAPAVMAATSTETNNTRRHMKQHTEIPIPRGFKVEARDSISGKETVYRVTSRLGAMGDDIILARAVEQCSLWHGKQLRDDRNERRRK